MKVKCGDIIKTDFGYLLVEAIKDDWTLIGHELKGLRKFWTKHPEKIKIINSEFRYKKQVGDKIFADLDDCWSARKSDYWEHKCNGQDGKDISFTKKDFESIRRKYCTKEILEVLKKAYPEGGK